jgi:OOP family OmpA-OmpF porin
MTTRMKTVLATLIAPAFAAGTAHAAEPGFYFGGSAGQSTMKASATATFDDGEGGTFDNTFHFDKNETGWKGFVGFNFLPFLGVEGGYVDFGSPSDGQSFGLDSIDGEVDATGWEAFLVGYLPIGPVDLFVKAGGIEASVDLKVKIHDDFLGTTFHNTDSESNEMFAYGAGAQWNIGKFGIRAEIEGYDVSKLDDLYLISAGVTYHL